jgi:hypothetical protein
MRHSSDSVVAFGVDRAVFLDQLHVAEHRAQRVPGAGNIHPQRDVQAGRQRVHLL